MIQLTISRSKKTLLIAPEHITQVGTGIGPDEGNTWINILDSAHDIWIEESPLDVARLKAAWINQDRMTELARELPIAMRMNDAGDGISAICCIYTKQLREESDAAEDAARSAEDEVLVAAVRYGKEKVKAMVAHLDRVAL